MITIYTTPSCGSCRKAKKWFNDREIKFIEKNIFSVRLNDADLRKILAKTENGIADIISTRAKIIMNTDVNIDEMKLREAFDFIIDNPSVLRRPIIVDDDNLQIGYNEDDIRVFIPKEYRRIMMCLDCTNNDDCDFKSGLLKVKGD